MLVNTHPMCKKTREDVEIAALDEAISCRCQCVVVRWFYKLANLSSRLNLTSTNCALTIASYLRIHMKVNRKTWPIYIFFMYNCIRSYCIDCDCDCDIQFFFSPIKQPHNCIRSHFFSLIPFPLSLYLHEIDYTSVGPRPFLLVKWWFAFAI